MIAALRPLLWALVWSLTAQTYAGSVLGWPWWAQVLAGAPATIIALRMSVHRSIRWRWLIVRHWGKMQRPLVYDEDGAFRGGFLPFERVCIHGDEDGPIEGHIHTRTLVLGRPRLRSVTVWRQE